MAGRRERPDARLSAARYQVDQLGSANEDARDDADTNEAGQPTLDQRAQMVEIAIQQSIRRGDFENLPGAGKPLTGLQESYEPGWWIRQKIERERLTGLGPPALTLRTENAELDDRLDTIGTEQAVREVLGDFNRRVIEARRQLQGGPPVVTPTRDIDAEVLRWRGRRTERELEWQRAREREQAELAALPRRERRRRLRERGFSGR